MANTVDKVIEFAQSQVGYLEKKDGTIKYLYDKTANAGYNNYTMYGYEMHKLYPSVMDYPAAWCDCFVDYCFYQCYGVSNAKKLLAGNFDDYTKNSVNLYKGKNAFHLRSEGNPLPGDQIFFSNNGLFSGVYHTGLVIKVENGVVYTIEGNTSSGKEVDPNGGAVCAKSYSVNNSKIYGYGRPPYDAEEINEIKIGTGLNGLRITTASLNIRETPSTTAKIVGSYKLNDKAYVVSKTSNNNKIWFKSDKGWFSANYCEGWIFEENSQWWYVMDNYTYPANIIKTIDGDDYIFDKNGWLITGDRISSAGAIIY